jgi:hypothetical protein
MQNEVHICFSKTFLLLFIQFSNYPYHFIFQNIEDGKTYNLVMYVKSAEAAELTVSLASSDGLQKLASATVPLVSFFSMFCQE